MTLSIVEVTYSTIIIKFWHQLNPTAKPCDHLLLIIFNKLPYFNLYLTKFINLIKFIYLYYLLLISLNNQESIFNQLLGIE
jgi:hypothetical protein